MTVILQLRVTKLDSFTVKCSPHFCNALLTLMHSIRSLSLTLLLTHLNAIFVLLKYVSCSPSASTHTVYYGWLGNA